MMPARKTDNNLLSTFERDGVMVVELGVEVGRRQADILAKMLAGILKGRDTRVVLDFQRTRHIHFNLTRTLVMYQTLFERFGAELAMSGLTRYISNVLGFMGFWNLERYTTAQDAISTLAPAAAMEPVVSNAAAQ